MFSYYKSTIFFILYITLTLGNPILSIRQATSTSATPICETSAGSPSYTDIVSAIEKIIDAEKNNVKCHLIGFGGLGRTEGCRVISSHGEAKISLCNRFDVEITCREIADAALAILNACEHNEINAGGKLVMPLGTVLLHK